ncbi:MAG TPA: cation:proton antiporter [Kofleriaceae bacterium]|nr:cation:proton antiporter [Kofleriaceae bacterium]
MIHLLLLIAVGGMMQAARSFTTDTSGAGTELGFGFLLLASYFTAKIFNRFGLPKLTGYIAAGVIAGPYVLEFVTKDMGVSLKVVSTTATAILALEAGSELEIKQLRPILKTLRGITLFAVVGSMFTIATALFLMRPMFPSIFDKLDTQQSIAVCFAIGVALSAQSPAVVMAMLAETRAEGPLSRTMLASVVVADLTVITLFSIVLAITGAVIGGQVDVAGTAISVAWELLGSMVFGLLLGALIGQFLLSVKKGASMFTLLVNVVVAEIGARVHLDPLIVMLTAGIWLRNWSRADSTKMMHEFQAAQLPVFLVFFALAGSKLDINVLFTSLLPVAIIAAVRASSFFMGAKIACKVSGAEEVISKYAWFGLVPQAGLALALALVLKNTLPSFGFDQSAGDTAAVILFGVVGFNECIAPIILRIMLIRSGEAGKKKGVDFAAGGH